MADFTPVRPAEIEWLGNTPASPRFGDIYYNPDHGLAESRHVFIDGNQLSERFAELPANGLFTIGETGFGTGLNCLAAAAGFALHAPASARLQLYSAELHPLNPDDLQRALAAWPELQGFSAALIKQWPPPAAGFHRIILDERIDLTLMLGEATSMWRACRAEVDAWFLDGFAPDRNAAMWTDELFRLLAQRSRPGASLATFTVAGRVRRALAAAGFEPARRPGFGRKREMLSARLAGPDAPPAGYRNGHAVIAGASLAGATAASALTRRGWEVTVVDPAGPAGGLRNDYAAVIHASPGRLLDAYNRFWLAAYVHLQRWLERLDFPATPEQGGLSGVIHQLERPRLLRKFTAAIAAGSWPHQLLREHGDKAVELPQGGWLSPAAWCRHLLEDRRIRLLEDSVTGVDSGTVLLEREGIKAEAIVLCTGYSTIELPGFDSLPLRGVRGQVTLCRATEQSRQWRQVRCHVGYLTPAVGDVHCLGASFDRSERELEPRDDDDQHNIALLRQHLPEYWQALGGEELEIIGHRVGLRCQSPDYLPLAGRVSDTSTWLSIAHGSRGLVSTPLCAELIADQISGLPAPVDAGVVRAVEVGRVF